MTGGQAAFAGFLYQILCSLERVARIATIDAQLGRVLIEDVEVQGDRVCAARLILEPPTGGDLVIEGPGERIVEQFKMRSNSRPWSPGEIIGGVLPDLYRDVGSSLRRNERARYRFVTDGQCPLPTLRPFLRLLHGEVPPDDPERALDDTRPLYRLGPGGRRLTARGLFRRIVGELAGRSPDGPTRVWHLLAGLEIQDGLREEAVVADIDAVLADMVEAREEARNKRDELIGVLFRLAQDGHPMTAEGIFNRVDLDPRRLLHPLRLPAILAQRVEEDARFLGYDAAVDVRAGVALPESAPVVVLTGESGQGKTWQLSRFALDLAAAGQAVVLLPARGGLERIEQRIVEHVWLSGPYDRALPLDSIADRLAPRLRGDDGFWLTVCIDDIQEEELVGDLLNPRWQRFGIRLVVSVQPRIARSFRQGGERAAVVEARDFAPNELQSFLARHGRNWTALPDDVLELLRRPILASLYVRLDAGADWLPANEYALMERYWRFATSEYRGQGYHRNDARVLKAMAGRLLGVDAEPLYPWPVDWALERGLCDGMRVRLTRVGLLREEGDDSLVAGHDRLLNWMVALWLADEVRSRRVSIADLVGILQRITRAQLSWTRDVVGTRLGYVLMDVLWLLSDREPRDQLAPLLLQLGRDAQVRQAPRELFRELLPTLGARILRALAAVFRQPLNEAGDRWLPGDVGHAVAAIGRHEPDAARAAARELLDIGSPPAVEAGLIALSYVPAPDLLDRLWEIHLENVRALDAGPDQDRMMRYLRAEDSFNALVSAAQAGPRWLDRKLATANVVERLDELLLVLLQLDPATGRSIWFRSKAALFAGVQRNRQYLARAIRMFGDREEIPRLENLTSGTGDRPEVAASFDTLVRLVPEQALMILSRVPPQELRLTRRWWLRGLAHRLGDRAHSALRAAFSGDWERQRDLATIYSGLEDLLDGATLDRIIDTLEERLAAADEDPSWQPMGERDLLRLVSAVRRPDLLAVLEARRGGRFEDLLVRRAIRRSGRSSLDVDSDGGRYRRILLAIGGEGVSQLVETELERPNAFARVDGLKAALWRPTDAIRAQLRRMATSPATTEQEQRGLAFALAVLDETEALAALVRTVAPFPWAVFDIRRDKTPFSNSIIGDAQSDLRSAEAMRRRGAVGVIALANRSDFTPILLQVLGEFPPPSPEARLAIQALDSLGQYAPEFLPRVTPVLEAENNRPWTVRYLLGRGDAEARAQLVGYLSRHPLDRLHRDDTNLALNLLCFDDSAPAALAFLRRVLARGFGGSATGDILCALARAGDRSAQNRLYEVAVQNRPIEGESWLAAIRGLAAFDPNAAFAAALRRTERTGSPDLPELLMTLDASRGIEVLLQRIVREQHTAIRWAIGRTLRWYADRNELEGRLLAMSRDPDQHVREAAAELCGWQPPGFLAGLMAELVDDEASEVEKAALEALRRQAEQRWTRELLDALVSAGVPRSWNLLFSAIDLGDPYLLERAGDQLCLWPIVDRLPLEYEIAAREGLDRRHKETTQAAETEDRRRRRRR